MGLPGFFLSMAMHFDDILFVLGAALMTTGAGLIYLPAAFLVGGAFCIAGGVLYGRYLAVIPPQEREKTEP